MDEVGRFDTEFKVAFSSMLADLAEIPQPGELFLETKKVSCIQSNTVLFHRIPWKVSIIARCD